MSEILRKVFGHIKVVYFFLFNLVNLRCIAVLALRNLHNEMLQVTHSVM